MGAACTGAGKHILLSLRKNCGKEYHMSVNYFIKRKRKCISAIATSLILLLTLSGCGTQKIDGKSLREHGMDIVKIMEEMVKNADYGKLTGGDNNTLEENRVQLATGDYAAPAAVYGMSLPSFQSILTLVGESEESYNFSEALNTQLDNKSASVLVNQLNSMKGVSALAGTSLYTAGKVFVSNELTENTIYLYTFQNGYPIAVVFTVGEDHAVTAQGTFLLWEDIDQGSLETLQNLLKTFGISDTLRQLPETP